MSCMLACARLSPYLTEALGAFLPDWRATEAYQGAVVVPGDIEPQGSSTAFQGLQWCNDMLTVPQYFLCSSSLVLHCP
ncbi:hypothetical protein BDZ45DRAFT_497356 [Acephala macrosclerotiorum]|nr:hypothetical protein BDZ45DRAFT_497356 [Acephala macrosclerotiorum]